MNINLVSFIQLYNFGCSSTKRCTISGSDKVCKMLAIIMSGKISTTLASYFSPSCTICETAYNKVMNISFNISYKMQRDGLWVDISIISVY